MRISTTAAAIWQQMMKIPEILAILKRNNHSKRKAGEVLMSQLRDYQLHQPPYDTSYIHNFDVPIKWWKTCQMDPPYLQYLAVKLFQCHHMLPVVSVFGRFVIGFMEHVVQGC